MQVTGKESTICAIFTSFSVSNTLISAVGSIFRNVLAGIEASAVPENTAGFGLLLRSAFT